MKIYCIFDCDEWKSYSSMRLIAVVDEDHLDNILNEIQKDKQYSDEDMETYIFVSNYELNEYE